jgi:predicted ribosomally synthesized peptide with SipW-like signal peptide
MALGVRARVVALLLAVAVLVGVGTGGVLALWSDTETVSGRMPVGVAVFGVGAPGVPVYASSSTPVPGNPGRSTGTLTFELGPSQAATLYNGNSPLGGAVAIPIQVDSLAQGHRGLHYDVDLDVTAGGIFAASEITTYRVATAALCTPALSGPGSADATPWAATYSASTSVATEFWCVVARYVPTTWEHENTATVTASNPVAPGTLEDSDSWSANAQLEFVPGDEGTHTVTFEFTTFRPGDAP